MAATLLPGLDALVEQRIGEAIARGEFDHLPGAGRPLDLDDDLLVPAELRIANRILRNAGCLPPEVAQLAEINALIDQASRDERAPDPRERRLRALLLQLDLQGRPLAARQAWLAYREALAARVGGAPGA